MRPTAELRRLRQEAYDAAILANEAGRLSTNALRAMLERTGFEYSAVPNEEGGSSWRGERVPVDRFTAQQAGFIAKELERMREWARRAELIAAQLRDELAELEAEEAE